MKTNKKRYSNKYFNNAEFPSGCEARSKSNWILKDNCPCCILEPLECLSNFEYHQKYPANNRVQIGNVNIYLCDVHLKELKEKLNKYEKV